MGGPTFRVQTWDEIEGFYDDLIRRGIRSLGPMLELVKSVSNEGASEQLGAHTSMHDLVVTALPASDGYVDYVRVQLDLDHGLVRMKHVASAGSHDTIERPSKEILPLFWRFMIEKFGVRPARDFAQSAQSPQEIAEQA